MGDEELAYLRRLWPVGTQVRAAVGLVDRGVHTVLDHTRAEPPFHPALLVLKTPDGEAIYQRPDWWQRVRD